MGWIFATKVQARAKRNGWIVDNDVLVAIQRNGNRCVLTNDGKICNVSKCFCKGKIDCGLYKTKVTLKD